MLPDCGRAPIFGGLSTPIDSSSLSSSFSKDDEDSPSDAEVGLFDVLPLSPEAMAGYDG